MSAEEDNVIHVQFGDSSASEDEVEVPEPRTEEDRTSGEEKVQIFSNLLEDGTVMVTLDARREDVVVPDQFRDEFRLNLNFDHLFGLDDLSYDDEGVRASLSFGGVDRWCDIPWNAVYMMRRLESTDVVLFPAQLPPEMMAIIPEIERAIVAHQESDASGAAEVETESEQVDGIDET